MVNQEKDRRVKDNIVAAVCRMINGHIYGVPLDQVSLFEWSHFEIKNLLLQRNPFFE